MLYSLEVVRANLRNREGKRVFYLGKGDQLTSQARDFLARERIEILPADRAKPDEYRILGGGTVTEKPEHMTHLHGNVLVSKTHPRIAFRGAIDTLEAELLLTQVALCKAYGGQVEEILEIVRRLIRSDVLDEPVEDFTLYGLNADQQRSHSHFPQDHYGIPHFMPDYTDGETLLRLNRCRSICRQAELAAVDAFSDRDGNLVRADIVQALNRMSSMLYILMIREKRR